MKTFFPLLMIGFLAGMLAGISSIAATTPPPVAPVELLMQDPPPWRGDVANWSWEEAGRANMSVAVLELRGNLSGVGGGVVFRPWTCHDWDGRRLCLAYDGWWVPAGSMGSESLRMWMEMGRGGWRGNPNESRRWAETAGRGGLS